MAPIPRGLAVQASTSRSWVSIAKAIRTASPFQHGISNTSAAQRRFEAAVATAPSCGRCRPRPVCGASSNPARFITRKTRLWFTRARPSASAWRFSSAVIRR
jgi:hypothetical protein